jgi:hypothetical protein
MERASTFVGGAMSRLPPFDPLDSGSGGPAIPAISAIFLIRNSGNSRNSGTTSRQRVTAGLLGSEVSEEQLTTADLPFPLGYGGLPKAQVEVAEVINEKFGITDPVLRKFNVLAWVLGYYQERGEVGSNWYKAVRKEQQHLAEILDEDHE